MILNSRNRLPLPALPMRVLTPALAEARRLIAAGIAPEHWPDDALNAYCDNAPLPLRTWLAALTDAELDDYAEGRRDIADMPPELRGLV